MRSVRERIVNYLTLRYDPKGPKLLPDLGWRDFVEYENIAPFVEPLLENTLRKIVWNAKNVGMGISGGIDTSTTLAIMRHVFPDVTIRTYCVSFGKDRREHDVAAHVAALYGTRHEEVVVEEPFRQLPEQIRIVGEPRWNLYASYLFEKAAKDGCEVLITGDGADELFGGYTFRYEALQDHVDARSYMLAHQRDWVPSQDKLIEGFDWAPIWGHLNQYLKAPLSPLGRVFLADYQGKLMHDFMPTTVAFSRFYKIRTESPFLQPEVMHIASHLPLRLKWDPVNKIGKIALRNILMQYSGLRPAVGGKIGFGMDLAEMWDGHVREMCVEHLEDPKFSPLGIRREWLPQGFSKADKHDLRYISKMLGLLALEFWLETPSGAYAISNREWRPQGPWSPA